MSDYLRIILLHLVLEERDVDWTITSEWIVKKKYWGEWTGLVWLRIGTSASDVVNAVMNIRVP